MGNVLTHPEVLDAADGDAAGTTGASATASGGRTLIHCFAGVNRSAALAIAVLMLRERRPLLDVARECFEARPFILSNETFRDQLVRLAIEHGLAEAVGSELEVEVVRSR